MRMKWMGKVFALVALAAVLPSPAYAWPTWEEAGWICASIIAEAASAGVATSGVLIIQTIGLQECGKQSISKGPEAPPSYLELPGPGKPASDVVAAMQALDPPGITPSGTPAEVNFINKVNVFVDRVRTLPICTRDSHGDSGCEATAQSIMTQMAADLEDVADAYDATGLTFAITQADIDTFQADCADGTCSAGEEGALAAAGLSPAERQALSIHLSTVPLVLSVPSVSLSTILHEAAQRIADSYLPAVGNSCTAGKLRCIGRKRTCLLGCYKKGASTGTAADPACLSKCREKFDGGADPTKSCFGRVEAKGGCLVLGDTIPAECKVDVWVSTTIDALHNSSPIGTANQCLAGKLSCLSSYGKCRLGVIAKAAKKGIAADPGKLQKCTDKISACYSKLEATKPPCLTQGDVRAIVNADDLVIDRVFSQLLAGEHDMNTQRCTGDTSVKCSTAPGGVGDCGGPLGTCEFYAGSTMPFSGGGVSTCVTYQWNGGISGTLNPTTGESAGVASVIGRTYLSATVDAPCPQCSGDSFANDGIALGVCIGGARHGLACDANGLSPTPSFGSTSLDCPPSPGSLIGTSPIDFASANDATAEITLSASSPSCDGSPGKKCACASCSGNSQIPCRNDADCAAAAAGTCTNGAGTPRQPNACIDDTSIAGDGTLCSDVAPVGDGKGECPEGPLDQHCAIESYRSCVNSSDCPAAGDTCVQSPRPCYLDNGIVGGTIEAQGITIDSGPGWYWQRVGSVFCLAPTSSSAVNAAAGLPGAGRLEVGGEASNDGTATTCPTYASFEPTSPFGVLDAGWTGLWHNATVPSHAKVTAAITGCANPGPPCGVCTYAGPVANQDAGGW